MSPEVALREKLTGNVMRNAIGENRKVPDVPRILIAAVDPGVRKGLKEVLQGYALNLVWVDGVKDAKNFMGKQCFAACFCEFWLQDGTYRELIRHVRRERVEIPIIIVSSPSCPQEFRDYLSAMNLGAVNFLACPYRRSDIEKMLELEIREDAASSNEVVGPQVLRVGRAA